jgi:hypothetical protein
MRLGLAAVDDVRGRIQQIYGHRGRADDPLCRIRRVLRRGAAHLTDTGWARLMAGIDAGDEGGQVAATWVARSRAPPSTRLARQRSAAASVCCLALAHT